jgi:branched-chain amino acid aminotransferase
MEELAAKAAGNYAAQFYPTSLANKEGFQQVIWTDATHTKLEEQDNECVSE